MDNVINDAENAEIAENTEIKYLALDTTETEKMPEAEIDLDSVESNQQRAELKKTFAHSGKATFFVVHQFVNACYFSRIELYLFPYVPQLGELRCIRFVGAAFSDWPCRNTAAYISGKSKTGSKESFRNW